jgi:low-affinity inorganic phosphate transporter
MLHLFAGLDLHTGLLLLLALAFVLFYEAINGFHDTANAVATVIYTRAMRSQLAVAMAALFNFFGVLLGGLSVAYAIVHMLPTDLLLNMGSAHGLAMVFSMLLAAIIWNLGTWYFGLPASSSHTLIGAIIGIGLTNALMTGTSVVDALNIPKVIGIFASLIISPIVAALASLVMSVFTPPKHFEISSASGNTRRDSSGLGSPSLNFQRFAGVSIVPLW